MARMGMDVEKVHEAGRQLKAGAEEISRTIAQIEATVGRLAGIWEGPDAQRFIHQWWPQHKKSLTAAQHHIDGLGQSALNNESEQRQASGADGGSATAPSPAPTAPPAGIAPLITPAIVGGGAALSAAAHSEAANKFVADWQGKQIDYDHAYGAQCFDVFRQYSHDVVGNGDIATNSNAASDIYNKYGSNGVEKYYDRIPYGQGAPQPGDVIVYGGGTYGHVAVITEVGQNGEYKVLEQNYSWQDGIDANDPATVREHHFGEKGTGVQPLGYLRPKS
ncbi:CHAP domain-containing protein [Smaragdicoccus niigatensis]|uniref:CHAP domain-containing protein n=1 Tax=Smaragdicoccus niigatensis TaxID=359359 RepID=UPI0003A1522A|nr:CHAP domain-containing protein [Smaragdicoccus niigatensis]